MRPSASTYFSLALLTITASAAIVKEGSTCVITPTQAATVEKNNIDLRPPSKRDVDDSSSIWEDNDPYSNPASGSRGVLNHFPRPAPSKGSSVTPTFSVQQYHKRNDFDSLEDDSNPSYQDLHQPDHEKRQSKPDDTPQILSAFRLCSRNSLILFQSGTYHIRQVMNTTDLSNVTIHIRGTFLWSADNLSYWTSRSYSVTYAGRSTAWLLGGRNIVMLGFAGSAPLGEGSALFDGQGQIWIDQNQNRANQQGRPISLTIWKGENVVVDGITWRQAQFWHTFVAYSKNVTMTNLDMNTTSNSKWKAVNTDGVNTWNSKGVRLEGWRVSSGDDCISVKGNSSDIHVSNVTCYRSGGMCIGSIGSNANQPDYVENVLFENVELHDSSNAAWIKTYPGSGYVRNVTFRNIHFENVNQPIYVTSCIYSYSNCDSSRIPITDIRWENITGTSRYNVAAGLHCSAAAPCDNLKFSRIDIKPLKGGNIKTLCSNIKNQASSGLMCTGPCPGSHPQQLSGNV